MKYRLDVNTIKEPCVEKCRQLGTTSMSIALIKHHLGLTEGREIMLHQCAMRKRKYPLEHNNGNPIRYR
jgi:hypothetical protein